MKKQSDKKELNAQEQNLQAMKTVIENAGAIVIGAGAGLSASAGLIYGGERFEKLFPDFIEKFKIPNMYAAAFYDYPDMETHWAYWSRHIHANRFAPIPKDTYDILFDIVKDKNYFVVTTNADHAFIRSGFDKDKIFYTQGDYGLFQCSVPCAKETYDNEDMIMKMVEAQSDMKIPTELIPHCPKCGAELTQNLRKDDTFVQDAGWQKALEQYEAFITENQHKPMVFLELGVGYNTPGIIKYPFWGMVKSSKVARYICINGEKQQIPEDIRKQSMLVTGDIHQVLQLYKEAKPL
ncbi:MAG: Sir2 silent information regulator family NAD-dependent deacetylase [Bacillota bacterium]